jgi:hypothetical protein
MSAKYGEEIIYPENEKGLSQTVMNFRPYQPSGMKSASPASRTTFCPNSIEHSALG